MPRKAKELSAIAVANLKAIRSPSDSMKARSMVGGADGLHHKVREESRSWILRVTVNGKRRAEAIARAGRLKVKTFKDCAKAYIAAHRAEWKNAKHAGQLEATLKTCAHPVLGGEATLITTSRYDPMCVKLGITPRCPVPDGAMSERPVRSALRKGRLRRELPLDRFCT